MATIAVLGTGLLGAGMVENLLNKGETVRIWNRTREKLAPLVERGAVAAEDPADCVRGAERVHLILSEDSAVDSVIEQLRPGLADGVPIIDHTTNRPDKVRARFDALRAANVRYVPTPVFMAPKHAQEGSGMMMMSGPKQDADDLTAALETMTGKLWHVGDRPDLASVLKLAGNSVYFAITGGAGKGKASFEMTMAHKDARLMAEAAGDEHLFVLPAMIAALQRGIDAGHGADDFAGFAKV